MLRITIEESGNNEMRLVLSGRIVGPWALELDRAWEEAAPRLGSRRLTIDLHDVTFVDTIGKDVLVKIVACTDAEIVARSLFTQDLADEVFHKANQA